VNARALLALALAPAVALALAGGIAGGLARTGLVAASSPWLGHAAVSHAALMICGFFGTVVGIERAVAARRRSAWLAPLASASAAIALVAGSIDVAAVLLLAASAVFLGTSAMLWSRERAAHTGLLAAAAAAWLAGNLGFALGLRGPGVLPWWFAFLVVTIAAERLEMMRLMPRRPHARQMLFAILVTLAAGAGLSAFDPVAGGVAFGLALAALAGWLLAFDVARRTVRASGLARYMAVCLISGYLWLAAGGLAWTADAQGIVAAHDAALHALGLGFIVSMVMAHAPVILPAVARIKLGFGWPFYLPLAALHSTLAWRLAGAFVDAHAQAEGAAGNAAAIVLFALTALAAALARRLAH
jgi:hypothetical protein